MNLDVIVEAGRAADHVLARYVRLPVAKAMDLGTPRGFDRAVAALAARLRMHVRDAEDAAVRAAITALDVDWSKTTAAQRRQLVAQGMRAAASATASVSTSVQAVFGSAATEVVTAARQGVRRAQGLAIAADFNAIDQRLIEYLRTSQATYVRDAYGRRHRAFAEEARIIVADDLEAGLGREDIARDLDAAARDTLAGKGGFYWEVVAGAFVAQGRSFAELSAYAEAGVEHYVIEAVLDERTTEICRFLHGKRFSVRSGLRTFEQLEAAPGRAPDVAPWAHVRLDPDSGRKILVATKNGGRTTLAEVTRSGVGLRDDRGEFGRALDEAQLAGLGVSVPPFHGLCRSTTVAEEVSRG
ncbi:head morphogenesis protein [Haliangium ochraceum]|uniref:Putative phage head morphogenesis protein n=1 Tax=Haliangium ochraceum (strain DSM 14365 / JCM 11303 / SMP-2) TaxID=502025 RepID=D0LLR1_HALO1|nr:head morphogenesis protein [Haliangium ochraceum]ACY13278.1 putative phage head morphogenesis protein [Haliangium ochraceum DSM 14365]